MRHGHTKLDKNIGVLSRGVHKSMLVNWISLAIYHDSIGESRSLLNSPYNSNFHRNTPMIADFAEKLFALNLIL
jgi:hypothetical protein